MAILTGDLTFGKLSIKYHDGCIRATEKKNTELIASSSSFNDKPIRETAAGPLGMELFQKEQDDLLSDLNDIPKKACDRRVRTHHHIYSVTILPF
jgi:hypothetical protein